MASSIITSGSSPQVSKQQHWPKTECISVALELLSPKSAQASEAWRAWILRGDKRAPLCKSSGTLQLEIEIWIEMVLPNKITPEWIYKANTKGPWSETRGPRIGGPGPKCCSSTAWIGHSNPYFSAVKYLHIRRCSIGTELNKASVLDEMWVLIRLSAQNNNWVRPTMKP